MGMPDDPALRIFPDEFVPNVQASKTFQRWAKSSPGDRGRWETFRDALLAGQEPSVPSMSTTFGRALVAAGRSHMSISHLVGQVTNPYPPSDPSTPPYFLWPGHPVPGPFTSTEPYLNDPEFSTYIYLIENGTVTRMMVDANGGIIWTWGIKTALSENRVYAHASIGEETWYRARFRFPAGNYFPEGSGTGSGDFNLHQQWHSNGSLLGTGTWNTFVGVQAGNPPSSARLYLYLRGGVMQATSPYTPAVNVKITPFAYGSLLMDHWYESVVRIKWYPDSRGSISWYVDGDLAYENLSIATLLQKADGTNDVCDYQVDNYRGNTVTTESWFDVAVVGCGPTRASIGA